MLKVAICDDDKYIIDEIGDILKEYKKEKSIKIDIEPFTTGEELIQSLNEGEHYDLIFLDIELNTTTGIIVGNTIRNQLDNHISKIVFITSKEGYQDELFDIQPIGYVKKPIDKDKVIKYTNLAVKLLKVDKKVFRYSVGREFKQVEFGQILYFENTLKKIKIVTNNGEYEFYEAIKNVVKQLPENFVKVHGSFVINYNYIDTIAGDSIIMQNNIEIPVSKSKIKELHALQVKLAKESRDGL